MLAWVAIAHGADVPVVAVIAQQGQSAPGIAGATLGQLAAGQLDCVSGSGNVSFRNVLSGASTQTDEVVMSWNRSSGLLRMVAREGDVASGWTPNTALYGNFSRSAIDNSGRVLFAGNPKPTLGGTPGASTGVWRAGTGNANLLMREGSTIPGTAPNPVTSLDEFGGVADDGSLSLAIIEGNFPTATDDRFVVLRGDDSTQVVLRASDPAPWAPAGLAVVSSPPTPAIASDGAWLARSRSGSAGAAVFVRKLSSNAPITVLARVGDSLPGAASGQTVFTLGSGVVNPSGVAAVTVNLSGLESGAWRFDAAGNAALIAKTGSQAQTPFGSATFAQVGVGVTNMTINAAGDVLFIAGANIPTIGSTSALWFAPSGGGLPQLVAAQGEVVPGTTYTLTTVSTAGFGIDSSGRVVLAVTGTLTDGGVPVRGIVTWSTAGGLTRHAIATIDSVVLGPSNVRQLSDVFLTISIPGGSGYAPRKAIADDGFFVWQAVWAGGESALVAGQLGVLCDTIDFNRDGLFPDDNDIVDFLNVLAGGPCSNDPPAGTGCGDIDFNNDGLFPSDDDLVGLLRVLAGGEC